MKKIIFVLIFISSCLFAQVSQQWIKSYGFSHAPNTYGNRLASDNRGNIYLACNIRENGNENIHTVKYNTNGDIIWYAVYDDSLGFNDYATGITIDDSCNVYVIGECGDLYYGLDYCTIKYNSSGIQQWVQIYNGFNNTIDIPEHIEVDHSGNVYITGLSPLFGFNDDYCTIKYNPNGVQQWLQRYNGPGNLIDVAVSLKLDHNNNVYVTGYITSLDTFYDICTIKYNTNGVQQWIKTYSVSDTSVNVATDMAMDQYENIYVTGFSYSRNNNADMFTIKYNSDGVQQWVKLYDGPQHTSDEAYAIQIDKKGNIIITGSSAAVASNYEMCTVKYNSLGVQQWVQYYDRPGSGADYANAIAIDRFNNIIITGYTINPGTNMDFTTIKYNQAGTFLWVEKYNSGGSNNDFCSSIITDGKDNIFVNGRCSFSDTTYENITIKYSSPPVENENISNEIPNEFSLSQNYPNPFNPSTNIKYQIPPPEPLHGSRAGKNSFVKLVVYDVLGEEVSVLVNEKQNPGTYEVEFDGSNHPSGIYFYTLKTESFNETKKMVLIK